MSNYLKIFLFFVMFGLLVYFNSMNNQFNFDDYVLLSNPVMSQTKFISSQLNPYLQQSFGVNDNRRIFAGYYRPLAHVVYGSCYGFFKNHHWQYHLFNLFIFVISASLIYLLIEKLTGNYLLAFLTSLFLLIHPIDTILVDNFVANALSFQIIFILATILLLVESLERKKHRTLYFLSLLFSFLSLFWYDMGMLTPVYVSAVVLIFRKDLFREKVLYLFPYFFISCSYFIFRSVFLNGTPFLKAAAAYHFTIWEHLATLFRLISWYISKLIYPQGIVMQWQTPILHTHLLGNCLGFFSLLAIIILLFYYFRFIHCHFQESPAQGGGGNLIQLALAWILLGWAPAWLISFVNPGVGAIIEPHWFIFSTLGFAILAAYFCLFIFNRMKIAGLALILVVVFAWSVASYAYNQIWKDEKTYALYWAQQAPHLKTTYSFAADAYQREGDYKQAIKYYLLALDGSNMGVIFTNIASVDQKIGKLKEAKMALEMAISVDPHYAMAYNNLGVIYFYQKQWEKAKGSYLQALTYDPLSPFVRTNLASIYLIRAEYPKAIDLCLQNLRIFKDDPDTLFLLINISIHQKDLDSVKKYAYRLINDQSDPAILTKLGDLMVLNNIIDIAKDAYTKALRVDSSYKDAYLGVGTLLDHTGNHDKAIQIWKLGQIK